MARLKPRRLFGPGRGTSRERGYGTAWDSYSVSHRKRYPLCIACAGRRVNTIIRPGDGRGLVDHIIPIDGAHDPLFWERWNHQGLCRACHGTKTERDDWIRNQLGDLMPAIRGIDDDDEARRVVLRTLKLWPKWLDIASGELVC